MVQLMRGLVLVAILAANGAGSAAWATTYYVSTTGSNSNDGLSETTPWRTIAFAVTTMVAGDTTFVRGGTYSESGVRFRTTGTQANPIRLANYPGEYPILSCTAKTGEANSFLFMNGAGYINPIGWITLEGFEVTNCYNGIKYYNLHDSVIKNMWVRNNGSAGIFGWATRLTLTQNIVSGNGSTTTPNHGLYISGTFYTITRNVIYGNYNYGIQQNGSGSSTFDSTKHASPEYSTAANWVVSDNTFAYGQNRGGYVVWGTQCTNIRIENNIFYENAVNLSTGSVQGIDFVSATAVTGAMIRNNHFYASGSGAQTALASSPPSGLVNTGNVINVSPPAFVNGGSNALPASPDFRLTASSPVNIARVNEFLNNSTNVVGAYKTVATPTGTITQNRIRLTFPMSTAVPIQNLSTTGVTLACSGTNCPGGGLTASSVSRVAGTDTQVDIIVNGFPSDACVDNEQDVTVSYNAASGTWTGSDRIGAGAGQHQKIFSFTNLSLTNQCTGSGPTTPPGSPHIWLKFDGDHADSSGNGLHGTPTGSPAFVAAKLDQGMQLRDGEVVNSTVGYGSGVTFGSQSLTIVGGIEIAQGAEALSKTYGGTPFLSGRNLHWSTISGTWRFAVGTESIVSAASEFAVTPGDHRVCLRIDSSTNTATLAIDGVTGTTAGSVKTYSDFTSSGNFSFGLPPDFQLSGAPSGVLDDWKIFTSLIDCADDYTAWNTTAPTQTGTFGQAAVQFEAVYLPELGGSPTVLNSPSNTKKVVAGGAVAIVAQLHCENVADCEETAFQLVYRTNGAGSWLPVPNNPTADGFSMWGADTNTLLNAGATTTRLTGSCTVTNGVTLLTASQIPSIDLPQDGCVMLRWIVRVADTATGYAEFRVQREGGAVFTGTEVLARIDVIEEQAGGMGF